jgi:signal transduction histidine kinase
LRTVLQRCAEALVEHLNAALACIWTIGEDDQLLEMQASAGSYFHLDGPHGHVPVGNSEIGLIAQERHPYITHNVLEDTRIRDKAWAERTGMVAFAGYPLTVEDRLVGVMALFTRDTFTDTIQEALAWVAGGIALGIDRVRISDALARSLAKIVRMNKSLRQKNAELDEFTYIASHDLQKPLRHLTSFSGMLRQDLDNILPERAEKDLHFITEAAEHMRSMVHNLLLLSRTGNAVMRWEQVALDSCVERAVAALSKTMPISPANIQHDPLPVVYGDQNILTELYRHLLENAFKFNCHPQPCVHLTATHQDGRWILGVADNGIGIQPEYHEQIFIPFKRLHGHGEYEGAGIGLSICRKAVERHGGNIWVESQAEQGTQVKFTLDDEPLDRGSITEW